eukprot:890398_1
MISVILSLRFVRLSPTYQYVSGLDSILNIGSQKMNCTLWKPLALVSEMVWGPMLDQWLGQWSDLWLDQWLDQQSDQWLDQQSDQRLDQLLDGQLVHQYRRK